MLKLGLCIMAAGGSQRFGKKNKLLVDFRGQSLIESALSKVPYDLFFKSILVTGSDEIIECAKSHDIPYAINNNPENGLGQTIKIGIDSLGDDLDGYLFLVCDQPLLKKKSIISLIDFWNENRDNICSLGFSKRLGNPVIFPKSLLLELKELKDNDMGKKVIIDNHALLKMLQVDDELELFDIDTISDLDDLKDKSN